MVLRPVPTIEADAALGGGDELGRVGDDETTVFGVADGDDAGAEGVAGLPIIFKVIKPRITRITELIAVILA